MTLPTSTTDRPSQEGQNPLSRTLPCLCCNRKFRTSTDLQRHGRSTGHKSGIAHQPPAKRRTGNKKEKDTADELTIQLQPLAQAIQTLPFTLDGAIDDVVQQSTGASPKKQSSGTSQRKQGAGASPKELSNVRKLKQNQAPSSTQALHSNEDAYSKTPCSFSAYESPLPWKNNGISLATEGLHKFHIGEGATFVSAEHGLTEIEHTTPATTVFAGRGPADNRHSTLPPKPPKTVSVKAETAPIGRFSLPPESPKTVPAKAGRVSNRLPPNSTSKQLNIQQETATRNLTTTPSGTPAKQKASTDLPQLAQPTWTSLYQSEHVGAWNALCIHLSTAEELERAKYRLTPYSTFELNEQRRCRNCTGKAKFHKTRNGKECISHASKGFKLNEKREKVYSCCDKANRGCRVFSEHSYEELDWQSRDRYVALALTPSHFVPNRRSAVVLDCEMAGVAGGLSEVVRFSAVDYFTAEILIDAFVEPQARVLDWRSKYSGVTSAMMRQAKAAGRVLSGWQQARSALLSFIDAQTVLIGQALNNDLEVLRLLHLKVVDSGILACRTVGANVRRQWGLKALCAELLGMAIQNHGKLGHDPIEDCLATREVVLFMTSHTEEFRAWGAAKREEEKQRREEEKQRLLEEQKKKAEEKAKKREEEQGNGPLTQELRDYQREVLLDLGYRAEGAEHGLTY